MAYVFFLVSHINLTVKIDVFFHGDPEILQYLAEETGYDRSVNALDLLCYG